MLKVPVAQHMTNPIQYPHTSSLRYLSKPIKPSNHHYVSEGVKLKPPYTCSLPIKRRDRHVYLANTMSKSIYREKPTGDGGGAGGPEGPLVEGVDAPLPVGVSARGGSPGLGSCEGPVPSGQTLGIGFLVPSAILIDVWAWSLGICA